MAELEALQREFGAALEHVDADPRASAFFRGSVDQLRSRMAVYRGNVVGAATRALAITYPVIVRIVGDPFFDEMAREYLRRHPSARGDLNAFGESMPAFLSTFEHTQDLPYLPDVARMEWLAHLAYRAADAPPFQPARLGALAQDRAGELCVVLAPGFALLESAWPLARIWHVHQDDYAGAVDVDLDAGDERLVVHRRGYRVTVSSTTPGSFTFLRCAQQGRALSDALGAAIDADPSFDLGNALREWVDAGVIVDLAHGHKESGN